MTTHSMDTRRTSRGGFTLVEMLIVMAALGVCMAMGTALILTTLRADKVGEGVSNRVSRRAELGRQFRADVSRAGAASDTLGDHTAGPTHLILAMPGGAAVVYRWDGYTLERVERTTAGETRRTVPVGPEGTTVELVRAAGVVTLRIAEPAANGPARRAEISAALGGGRR